MRRQEYEQICEAVGSGVDRYVENLETREIGRVTACRQDGLEVDIYGRQALWEKEKCEGRREPGRYGTG